MYLIRRFVGKNVPKRVLPKSFLAARIIKYSASFIYLKLFPSITSFCVQKESDAKMLQNEYPEHEILYGDEGMVELVRKDNYDLLVNAPVSYTHLTLPTKA